MPTEAAIDTSKLGWDRSGGASSTRDYETDDAPRAGLRDGLFVCNRLPSEVSLRSYKDNQCRFVKIRIDQLLNGPHPAVSARREAIIAICDEATYGQTRKDPVAYKNKRVTWFSTWGQERPRDCRFNVAVLLEPKKVDGLNERGAAYAKRGEYKLALMDFNEAIRLTKNSPSSYLNRGSLHQRHGRLRCRHRQILPTRSC